MVCQYPRYFIAMAGTFEDYMAKFSARTRSTLRRKARRFSDANGGNLDVREYRGTRGLEDFLRVAGPLSERTYQARMKLKSAVPADPASRDAMRGLAAADLLRAYILFLAGTPASYLFLRVKGRTLTYAHVGFDSRYASLCPGTVLQLVALERLFGEGKFDYFDFTAGEGDHKSLFATGSVTCETFLLLKPTPLNRAILTLHGGFTAAVRQSKALVRALGVESGLRSLMRV